MSSGPTGRDEVALTFHVDGDVSLAGQLLDALATRHAPATAFIVGDWLAGHREWGPRLRDAGLELANHTQTHPKFSSLTPEQMDAELSACRSVLLETTGSPGAFFRPSGTVNGTDHPSPAVMQAAARQGYATVLGFDVDPHDYRDPGASGVVAATVGSLKPGSIVSLHFGHFGTIAAIPHILDAVMSEGLQPVTASHLLRP